MFLKRNESSELAAQKFKMNNVKGNLIHEKKDPSFKEASEGGKRLDWARSTGHKLGGFLHAYFEN